MGKLTSLMREKSTDAFIKDWNQFMDHIITVEKNSFMIKGFID